MLSPSCRLLVLSVALFVISSPAQVASDQAARMVLDAARRAYNEKQYPFAANQFRQFLAKYGSHPDAPQARYGLALSLMEGNERNYQQAADELAQIAGNKAMPEYPFVIYHLGLARRSQGVQAVQTALVKPAEANPLRDFARQRFEEAAKQFGAAAPLFAEKAKDDPKLADWVLRSRCDEAEMWLRIKKPKEALAALSLLHGDDAKKWRDNKLGHLGLYFSGFASFLLDDYPAAGKALSRETVLNDDTFGTHARYLLARVHHLNTEQNEREDARTQYQAVLTGYDIAKKKAAETLRTPQDPETKARLERLIKTPPDHVTRAAFYLGAMQYEDGRFGEALEQFKAFATANPDSPLGAEAILRQGFCLVQTGAHDAAIKVLQPLADKVPPLADQAMFWIGKAQAGKVDPAKGEKYDVAIDTIGRAADRAGDGNKGRRGEMMVERARLMNLAGRYREASDTYQAVLSNNYLPPRAPELLLERAASQQLAGEYSESEKTLTMFLEGHKGSILTPTALFRRAENSVFFAQKARKDPNAAERAKVNRWLEQAIERYGELIAKYPESPQVNQARQGVGTAYYQLGDLDKAQKAYESISAADRNGDLLAVNYQLADIYLRQTPAKADDAVAAGRLEEKLKNAADLLEVYVANAGEGPIVPDALLKLGYCRQRQAGLIANKEEQRKIYSEARVIYERVQQKFAKSEAFAPATFERAKVATKLGDPNTAMNELKRFSADPLKKAPIAPMALLALANMQRSNGKAADAVSTLDECRKTHEGALSADPARKDWVASLRYHHAAALREAGKLDEARALFDDVTRSFPHRPEGWDAALRAGQTQKEQGEKRIADGRKLLAKADQKAAAEKLIGEGVNDIRAAVQYLAGQDAPLKARKVEGEEVKTLAATRSRIQYETAWGLRSLAEMELSVARGKIQQERRQKRLDDLSRGLAPGQPQPQVALPEVDFSDVPVQPSETQAMKVYQGLIESFAELVINADARLELSEMLAARGKHTDAVKLLQGALEGDKEPSADLLDKIKVRLSACLLDQGARGLVTGNKLLADPTTKPDDRKKAESTVAESKKTIETALEQVQGVSSNEKSKLWQTAVYREAECLLQLGKTDEAVKLFVRFRDDGKFYNLPGLTDRALLRLGYALGELKQWDPSRQAYQAMLDRHGSSPWIHEARYGIGWALQNLGRYDDAANTYAQVVGAVTTELAARAQLNVGLCRLAQKRPADAATALLVVPFTYDYPDLSGLALLEAARALHEDKQTAAAIKLLQRILRDYPGSAAAEAARKRLTDLGEA